MLCRYMEWALAEDQGIGRQDFTNAIISVARNQDGAYIAWNFLKANWNTIFDRFNTTFILLSNEKRNMKTRRDYLTFYLQNRRTSLPSWKHGETADGILRDGLGTQRCAFFHGD